ncbi:Uma2 family endonuclease [Leptolyngbya sp. NK1-12]|uniref:Uma2 family endonuclease n=1 Tax=Leptolyngbya sp. NK1-12 TaxID=2547451 RepID=A0AA96WHD0_9CYAN|nr:Uma2 family endonuclease [Leptolyngbya sp. NK1-12]WNZ24650.1 Uma2 family endonuclease [Leptolyngbya sp. NK1-12]
MARKPLPTEQRIVLSDVSWQQFEKLLVELGPERQARLTYLRGKLEMMTPIDVHERCSKLIDSLILVLVDEMAVPLTSLMPVTLKQVEIGCATEPDACYYLEERPRRTELDLTQDLPPDLLVEVALTRSQIEKLPIYASMGIPEVWRYVTTAGDDMLKGKLSIYQLQDDDYVEQSRSMAFPFLPAARILEFMEQSDSMSLAAALRLLRAWVQERQ